ncbi:chromosomal replication initiator protein DnaA [Thermodesulfatator atlanticus]
MERLWEAILDTLRNILPEASFRVWIKPLKFLGLDGNYLFIACPNQFSLDWIKENYLPYFEEALKSQKISLKIKFKVIEESSPPIIQAELPYDPTRLIGRKLSKRFTFEEFVVGECNRLAYATCWAIANKAPDSPIIYLCAGTGLGKSHLSQAIGNHLLQHPSKGKICYLTAQDFTAHVVKALRQDRLEDFKEKLRHGLEILMLEEVHRFSGKDFTQKELALTLDYLYDLGKIVVFTANRPPQEIEKLDESLRSRFQAGAIIKINPPDYQTRLNIIKRKAKKQGITLSEEVTEFLAKNLRGDIRQIESAIVGLVARSSLLREPITLALAQELVQEIAPKTPALTKDFIVDLVCKHFRVSREELFSRKREKKIAFPRQVAMYLCRRFTDESLQSIGKLFNRDHATVVYAVKNIDKKISQPGSLKYQIEYLCREIEEYTQPTKQNDHKRITQDSGQEAAYLERRL